MKRASLFTGVGARRRLVVGLAVGLVWGLGLGLGLAPSVARAEGACEGKERVAQEYSLSAGDLRKALEMPEGVAGFGRSGCIFWSEDDLEKFRAATVKNMHSRVQAAFGDRFRAEKGLGAGEEISCRVEFGGLPEVTATFDRPQEGESPLGNYLMATPCSGKTKRNHYAQATVDWEGLTPRVVCENIWLVGAGCGRAPSTLGPAVVVDRSPAILKRPVAEDERPAGARGGPGRALDVR